MRHTCDHDTGMTFQVHMNNCGQQPERNKTRKQLLQVGNIGIRSTNEFEQKSCSSYQPHLEVVQKLSAKDLAFDELQWDPAYPRISFYEHQPQLSYLEP